MSDLICAKTYTSKCKAIKLKTKLKKIKLESKAIMSHDLIFDMGEDEAMRFALRQLAKDLAYQLYEQGYIKISLREVHIVTDEVELRACVELLKFEKVEKSNGGATER